MRRLSPRKIPSPPTTPGQTSPRQPPPVHDTASTAHDALEALELLEALATLEAFDTPVDHQPLPCIAVREKPSDPYELHLDEEAWAHRQAYGQWVMPTETWPWVRRPPASTDVQTTQTAPVPSTTMTRDQLDMAFIEKQQQRLELDDSDPLYPQLTQELMVLRHQLERADREQRTNSDSDL